VANFDLPLLAGVFDLGDYFFWKLLALIGLLLAMRILVFKPMFAAQRRRQARIEEAIQKADHLQAEALRVLERHKQMIKESDDEAARILAEANAGVQKASQQLTAQAEREGEDIIRRARNEIRLAQNKAMADLRKAAVAMSMTASAAVLSKALTEADRKALTEEAISAATRTTTGR
jgi:F-type H+-transporting ATPase subunit b